MNRNHIALRVWGEWACFTRPEMKVERVSYPLMTPSAARGVLEAIFWEPQMYYVIDSIRVVRRIRWTAFRRNEVKDVIQIAGGKNSVTEWMKDPSTFKPLMIDGKMRGSENEAQRTQRNMLALKDVEYIITAEVHLTELGRKTNQPLKKYLDEIERRARAGKCFHRPSLGVREFAADFEWEADAEIALTRRKAELSDEYQMLDDDLGLMLYDLFDHDERAAGFRWQSDEELRRASEERETQLATLKPAEQRKLAKEKLARTEGTLVAPQAAFFRARVRDSVMDCHPSRVELFRQERKHKEGN